MTEPPKQPLPDFAAFAGWLEGHGIEAIGIQDAEGRTCHLQFYAGETAFIVAPYHLDDGQIRLGISEHEYLPEATPQERVAHVQEVLRRMEERVGPE